MGPGPGLLKLFVSCVGVGPELVGQPEKGGLREPLGNECGSALDGLEKMDCFGGLFVGHGTLTLTLPRAIRNESTANVKWE